MSDIAQDPKYLTTHLALTYVDQIQAYISTYEITQTQHYQITGIWHEPQKIPKQAQDPASVSQIMAQDFATQLASQIQQNIDLPTEHELRQACGKLQQLINHVEWTNEHCDNIKTKTVKCNTQTWCANTTYQGYVDINHRIICRP